MASVRTPVVIDTNVLIVANQKAPQADNACMEAVSTRLIGIQQNGRVILDNAYFILDEYRRNLSMSGQPGLGDAFFRWLWNNQAQAAICSQVNIEPQGTEDDGQFGRFPADPDLEYFDRSDRKFVAAALASGENPPIINATDSDWRNHQEALARYVRVEECCL